ncbi:tetratricopeptide repeat protein [Alkalilimnicola ehrlichii]|nr:tetratricopeptide repeat protein [Alkalilimnicola ehrlichii]
MMRKVSSGVVGAVLASSVLLSACATTAEPGSSRNGAANVERETSRTTTDRPNGDSSASAPEETAPQAPLRALPAAAAELVRQAEEASAQGRHDEAASLLERALRIEPQHPVLWQNLAVVRYRQGDYAQAEQLAMRSNRLSGDYPALQLTNWRLIAVSRELRGDTQGAAAAAEQVQQLRAVGSR